MQQEREIGKGRENTGTGTGPRSARKNTHNVGQPTYEGFQQEGWEMVRCSASLCRREVANETAREICRRGDSKGP